MKCVHDHRSEFLGIEFQELLQSYGVKSRLTTVRNLQSNGILEHRHQVIRNLLCSTYLMSQSLSTFKAQQELLAPVTWAINSTYHTTLQAMPGQLAFQRDMIMPTAYLANWAAIHHRCQEQSSNSANKENNSRVHHEYRLNNRVLVCHGIGNPYLGKLMRPTEGPYKISSLSMVQSSSMHMLSFVRQTSCRMEHPYPHLFFGGPCDVIFLLVIFGFFTACFGFLHKSDLWYQRLALAARGLNISLSHHIGGLKLSLRFLSHCPTLCVRHISEKLAALCCRILDHRGNFVKIDSIAIGTILFGPVIPI